MNGLQLNSITGAGTAAATSVASALIPKRHASQTPAKAMATSGAAGAKDAAAPPANSANGDISATDFLSLLVSELKNQDPTQPTDPNAYITQLVGVNSLQQLIQINAGLAAVETPSSGTTGS
jgi:flagellar basal-body rod modification protein FlgD